MKKSELTRRTAAALFAIGLALTGSALTTGAASTGAPKAAAPTEACYFNVDTGEHGCTSISIAERQRATNTGRVSTSQLKAAGLAPSATYLLATIYENVNYNALPGASLDFTGSSTYCTNTWSGEFASAWKNRVSSFATYANCRMALFSGAHQSGAVFGPATDSPRVGALNDASLSYRLQK